MFEPIFQFLKDTWHEFKPVVFIDQYQAAVLLRKGLYRKILLPGVHFRIPFIDQIFITHTSIDTLSFGQVTLTTTDNKTISVDAMIRYRIIDPKKNLIDTDEWKSNAKDFGRGTISEYLEDCNWEDIKLKKTKNQITKRIQANCDSMGVEVLDFMFTDKCLTTAVKVFADKSALTTLF